MAKRKWRADNISGRILPFEPLLSFANEGLNGDNWQDGVFKLMGEEKSCWVTYQSSGDTRREKMLECDISANLQIELFGTAVVFDQNETISRISEAIVDIEDVLPAIKGKPADLDSALKLQQELRALIKEIASARLESPSEQIRVRKLVEKIHGKVIKRDASLFPDRDIFFKSWLYEGEDLRDLAFFQLALLFHELLPPAKSEELVIDSKWTGRKFSLKVFDDLLASKIHVFPAGEESAAQPMLKLSICTCGCNYFFLQAGDRDKSFYNDRHRSQYHNLQRAKSGASGE
jgi:hypothetical protein